ncbi:MetQ/NlpA family ABC transporter substrate-binding protein [Microbacterium sp. cf332]|uniref:MetQ/NlpA family ABC transporter substrate-binding protein n=1 Tax=Microbacterium sp. cf332 TaxID=1761804 RepID=UPI0008871140|nr:MetQ/NlpA family ABC transporter substrate-binding protein [Microbacterium sp. cf332]SDQ09469.1 D-methionine transport system substrate-binding protein [Microbacterium sp. cf332]
MPLRTVRSRIASAAFAAIATAVVLTGCAASSGDAASDVMTLRVGAVTSPATDIVEAAGAAIADGYEIELVEVSDYVTINNMLAAGDIDANFSQHEPYMQEFNAKNGASLEAVQPIYNFVIAFYSKTLTDIDQLPEDATVAIPNDASNTARALKLLADAGIIGLSDGIDPYAATLDDVVSNPQNLQFLSLEINQLNTAYDEADLVFQWPSHIAALGLTPQDDGLLTELDDRFALQLVVPSAEADSDATKALIDAFTSDEVRKVIDGNDTIEAAF